MSLQDTETGGRRRRADAESNFTRIIEVAGELLQLDPDTSVDEIAAAAGVSRATVYRHFRSRLELVSAARQQIREATDANETDALRPPGELASTGPEPAIRWRAFSQTVVDLAEALDVQLVVFLGAMLADVPHTRPVHLTGLASDEGLMQNFGLDKPSYEGPTGIVGVLHAACADAGLPTASLWAAVPHYVAVVPNPKGALALMRKLESVVGVTVDGSELETAAADYERQVSRAVELDPDVQAFVERLERNADAEDDASDASDLPSGDVLAREFQRFLRQRGNGPS